MKRIDMNTACCGKGASGIARSLALAGMMTGLCDAEGKRKFFDEQDGWLDLSEFIEHPMGLGHPSVTVTHLFTWTYDESGRLVAPPTGTMMGAGEMDTSIRPEVRLCSTSPDL